MKNIYCRIILFFAICMHSLPGIAQVGLIPQVTQWINDNNKQLNLQKSDLAEMKITGTSRSNKLTFAYIQQYCAGLKVHNAIYSVCFDSSGKVVSNYGRFVYKINNKASNATPSVTAVTAVTKAATYLTLPNPATLTVMPDSRNSSTYFVFSPAGISKQNITAELMWVTTDDGKTVQLAWNITIDVINSADYMYVKVNAANGAIISAENATVHENKKTQKKKNTAEIIKKNNRFHFDYNRPDAVANASYKVIALPTESPSFGPLTVVNNPWLNAGITNPVTVFGWQSDGTTEFNYTRGNNVFTYDDTANLDAPGHSDTSSTASPNFNFIKTPDFTQQPHVTNNMRAATTNLFYVTNMMHDISYQYGFDEPSGNFQVNNNSRGGAGNDPLKAESQDGSGTDNANMVTLPDGQSPRMQMYLWDAPPDSLTVNTPATPAGNYTAVEGAFSTNNILTTALTGNAVYYNDNIAGTAHTGCVVPTNSLAGKIAFIIRGGCNFTQKVKAAQTAGAIAVIMIDNVTETPFAMGGTDNTITIPAFMISQADGAFLASYIGSGESITLHPSPPMLDGDYDDEVIAHEYTHGISNRLTGGPTNTTCLANAEQGGEGWSDYVALMVTQNWAATTLADSLVQRTVGTYVSGQPTTGAGLRTYPYTVDMSVDPHTYADMNGGSGSEVHYIGEIWTSALWDMTWRIIQEEGNIEPDIYNASSTTGGNVIALNDVITGMKLQPCSPGFLDARDAILKADSLLYNNKHKCAIWNAFARRGMGFSAQEGSSNTTSDQTVAFDIPTAVTITKTAADSLNSNDTISYTINASCGCVIPANVKIIDTLPAGISYLTSSAGTLSGNIVTINPINFTQQSQTISFTVTAKPAISGCPINYIINDNRDGSTIGGFATTGGWSASSAKSASPTHSWFATESSSPSNIKLTSSAFLLPDQSTLSFNHYFNTENTYDGGVVEISTNGGTTWQDLGSKIIKGNYTATMDASTTLAGKQAFTGASNGFEHTVIDLSSFTGQTVSIRFRFTTDNGNSTVVEGWFVDDIQLASGCGVKNVASLYTNNVFTSNGNALTFIRPSVSTTIDSFSVSKIAGLKRTTISWKINNEVNANHYEIYRSINGSTFNLINTTANTNATNYTIIDSTPITPDTDYYRLEVINNNGSIVYSNIKYVVFDSTIINSFSAAKVVRQQQTNIAWTVNNENNVSEYEIDRSIDSLTWTSIDTSTITGDSSYNIIDLHPVVPATNYYRLKIYNQDGTITYSAVQSVGFVNAVTADTTNLPVNYSLTPNPANDHIIFNDIIAETVTINIYDGTGKLVIQQTANSNTNININILAAGLYYYKLKTASGYTHTGKLIINR